MYEFRRCFCDGESGLAPVPVLQPGASRGEDRPATDYCSVGCRRAAEYEIRRVSRRLEELEGVAHRFEQATAEYTLPNAGVSDWQRQQHESRVRTVDVQIARARERMRDLLDDEPVET